MFRFLIFIPLLLFISCSPPVYNTYSTTSFIDNTIDESFSNLILIPQAPVNSIQLGTLVGSDVSNYDSSKINYILFAPTRYYGVNQIDNLNLPESVPISASEADQLLSALNSILTKWSAKTSDTSGIFYKFTATPEDKRFRVSKNVDYIFPSFNFYFENTEEGSAAYIYIGRDTSRSFITIDSLSKLKNFTATLSKAISYLKKLNNKL